MTLKNVKYSSDSSQSTLHDLKEGECGGCGTFENVSDNCCTECAKGYPEETDTLLMWKKLRAPVDYSLKAELERAEAQSNLEGLNKAI